MTALGVVLLVLLGIGLLPVGVWVRFDRGDLALRVKVGPFGIPILPKKPLSPKKQARQAEKQRKKQQAKRTKKRAKQQAREQAQNAPEAPKKKKLNITPAFIRDLAHIGVGFLGGLRRKLYLPELTVYLCMGGGDAAAQAEGYGRAWAILGAASPALDNIFRIGRRDLQAVLDWSVTSTECFVQAEVRIRVGGVLYLALRAGVQFLKAMIKNKNQKKAVQTT